MIVAASTGCFPEQDLSTVIDLLIDLEFSAVEIHINEERGHLKPSDIIRDFEGAVIACRQSRRLTPIGFYFDSEATGDRYIEEFTAVCKLAKAIKIVTVTIRASELGTPFNEEVERLRVLVDIAMKEGVVVGVATEKGRMMEDTNTIDILCRQIRGLSITLDPSHFLDGHGNGYDDVLNRVSHVRMRDSTKNKLQVRVGQGLVDFGRLVTALHKSGYDRTLCVDLQPTPNVDMNSELRKMRLLLESLL